MKKEDIVSLIVYILMLGIALIVGFTLVKNMFSTYPKSFKVFSPYLFAILTIVVGVVINAVGLEVGHVLGGLIGGYSIVSFNVFGFCWYKSKGDKKFGFKDFDGLTGETILAPKKDKPNPKMYVWLPLIMYLVELIVCIIIYSIGSRIEANDNGNPLIWLATASIIIIAISSMMALYNFVPAKLDSMTDGYRLTLISKPINVEAYNELMRIENLQRDGLEVKDVRVFEEVTDFTTSINQITVYENLAQKDFEGATKLIDKMCENPEKISHTTYYRLLAQKLYIKIITLPLEEAKKYYDAEIDDKVRRFISNDISMESIRAYVLIAGILDDSLGEVQFANAKKPKAMKRALASRAKIEEVLYRESIDLVKKAHPDWDIANT